MAAPTNAARREESTCQPGAVHTWPKDRQRAVFQPVGVATFAMSAAWLGGQGTIPRDVMWLFVLGLPAVLAGTWAGLKLYGWLDEAQFRRLVLVLLTASGVVLLLQRPARRRCSTDLSCAPGVGAAIWGGDPRPPPARR